MAIMRVAFIPDNRTGGMSRTMYCTGDELQRMGHTVGYIFEDDFSWRVPTRYAKFFCGWEAASMVRRRIAAGERWDIVEIHEHIASGYAFARLWDRTLPPMVVFSYGIEERGYAAMRNYQRAKRITFPLKSRLLSMVHYFILRWALLRADHVICSNQEDVDYLRDRLGIDEGRLTCHFSGVTEDLLKAGGSGLPRDPNAMLFYANWLERKGIRDLVPAVAATLNRHPDAFLTVAGCGGTAEVVKNAFPVNLQARIHVRPHIPDQAALIGILASHSILVLPSYFEGHPLVMVESAAMGLAIVTTPICGMRDFLKDRISGFFFPAGDPTSLAVALQRLINDPVETQALGREARVAAARHTWAASAQNLERAYRSVLVTRPRPTHRPPLNQPIPNNG